MKKILATFVVFAAFFVNVNAQETAMKIHWMSFEEAVTLNKTAPRKLFIDVYTDWCGWCKRMDATTFKDSAVIENMNRNFYAVKLDAERKDTVIFDNRTFVYKPEYKAHELALALLNGQMSYPSFVFLDEKFALLSPLSGYQTVDQLVEALTYFGSNIYQQKSWDEYRK
jgi:thioredoxin-related protein